MRANPPGGRRPRGLQRSEHQGVLLVGDLVSAFSGVVVSMWVWTITAGDPFSGAFVGANAYWFAAVPVWVGVLTLAHRASVAFSIPHTIGVLARGAAALLALYLTVYFYAPRQVLPRLVALYVVWELALLTLAWRLTYIWLFTETALRRRVLIVGAGRSGSAILRVLRTAGGRHTSVVGLIDDDPAKHGQIIEGIPVLGGRESLHRTVDDQHVSEVILAITGDVEGDLVRRLVECQEAGVDLVRMSNVYEDLLLRVPVEHLASNWLLTSLVDAIRAKDASRMAKRALDIGVGSAGLVVLLVLLPLYAAAIWLESGRPIFYQQVRVGKAGRLFTVVKFRTMVQNAEGDRAQWAKPNDPRVTRVGRLLRRTRLDELPQVLNVLRGDMSLVGPRPERPEFVEDLEREIPFYRTRLIVKPGVTGWAQINHPYGDSVADALAKLEYDLYYIKHRSLLFDLTIMVKTISTVATLKGT